MLRRSKFGFEQMETWSQICMGRTSVFMWPGRTSGLLHCNQWREWNDGMARMEAWVLEKAGQASVGRDSLAVSPLRM